MHNLGKRTLHQRNAKRFVEALMWAIIDAVAPLLDFFVTDIYARNHDNTIAPPLIRQTTGASNRSRPSLIDADCAWSVIARARLIHGVSARAVLRCPDPHAAVDAFV